MKLRSFLFGLLLAICFGLGFMISFHHNVKPAAPKHTVGMCTIADAVAANKTYQTTEDKYRNAIVSIYSPVNDHSYCTGVVVSDTRMITAAHCLLQSIVLGKPTYSQQINVKIPGTGLDVIATLINAAPVRDYALLSGNFKDFNKIKAGTRARDSLTSMRFHNLSVCGYVANGELLCDSLKDAIMFVVDDIGFKIKGSGFVYPGMSGGPCIDLNTGVVIGVNFGMQEASPLVNPIFNIFSELGDIEP